jgi:hypothetical protein
MIDSVCYYDEGSPRFNRRLHLLLEKEQDSNEC